MTNTKKVSTFRCIVIFMTILLFLYAMAEVLIASFALNGTAYKNALRYERDYNKLAEKYTAVDFTIACLGMNPEARAENARLQALWREEWQDFDELTAYYSRSDEAVKQLEETTKECRLLASRNGSIASSIENQAKERQYVGIVFMSIGGTLMILETILLLRALKNQKAGKRPRRFDIEKTMTKMGMAYLGGLQYH